MIDAISKAYRAENLPGSCLTLPLRSYNEWFQTNIQTSRNSCERTAWKACYVATALFAYLTLGILAIVGIAINACLIPPENGYSFWATLNGTPAATEKFCKKLRSDLLLACLGESSSSGSVSSSSNRLYSYNLHKSLTIDIQDVFEQDSFPQQSEDPAKSRSRRMEAHIAYIQNTILTLSQKHNWHPENQGIRTVNHRTTVIIPIPDHIPFPNFNPM